MTSILYSKHGYNLTIIAGHIPKDVNIEILKKSKEKTIGYTSGVFAEEKSQMQKEYLEVAIEFRKEYKRKKKGNSDFFLDR